MNWMLMPLKRYAEFSGRSRRQEFWMWQLFKLLVVLAFGAVVGAIVGVSLGAAFRGGGATDGSAGAGAAMIGVGVGLIFYLIFFIAALAIVIPDIAVAVRRLHDTDRSGLWLLSVIVPYILGYVVLFTGAAAQSFSLMGIGGAIALGGFAMALVMLVFFCLPGTVGPNRYGADPLAAERAGVVGEGLTY